MPTGVGDPLQEGFVGALEHARAALALADDLADDALRVDALAILAFLGSVVGDPEAPAHAARAHDLASAVGDARLLHKANGAIANVLDVRRSVEEARALIEREYEEWHERDELLAADRRARRRERPQVSVRVATSA